MMGNFLFLATEGKGGVGLNLDLIETNLFNLTLVLGFVIVFGRKVLTEILSERKATIETAIKDTEARQKEAASALDVAKQNLAQAKAEAETIRATSLTSATNAKADIAALDRACQRNVAAWPFGSACQLFPVDLKA